MGDEIMGGHAGGHVGSFFRVLLAPVKDLWSAALRQGVEVDVGEGTGVEEEFGNEAAESQPDG